MTVVFGTAGHIDHGKTSLLRALTGIDADRLPEERSRGMTIDVGYAHLALDDGTELDFVDVPGHDRLVGNMLVGAGEIDTAMLVVAADDGPRAQTFEHLELLDALGIERGVAVVTKTDAVSADRVREVVDEVRGLLDRTTLRGVQVVPASAVTREGLDELRRVLRSVRDVALEASGEDGLSGTSTLPVDRVFTVRGRGTVVTGSLRGAPLAAGATLRLVPGPPDVRIRVREVQVHGRPVDRGGPGRLALNIALPPAGAEIGRGSVLTTDPSVVASDRMLVAFRPPAQLAAASRRDRQLPTDRARVIVHTGTAHAAATIGRSGREAVDLRDGDAVALLRLDRAIAVAPGAPLALRRPSPGAVVGGGRVLDPDPPRGVARRRVTLARLEALAAATPRPGVRPVVDWNAARLDLHGATAEPPALAEDVAAAVDTALRAAADRVDDGDLVGARRAEVIRAGALELRRAVARIGPPGPTSPARANTDPVAGQLVAERLDALIAAGQLEQDGDRVRRPDAATPEPDPALASAMDRVVELLGAVAPPALSVAAAEAGCPAAGIRELERTNRIVRLDDDLAWAFPAYRDLTARALALASREPLTPAAFRDATGTSRKYVMAILEDLDRRAILRRTPAGHVPGPRAPAAAAQTERVPAGPAA